MNDRSKPDIRPFVVIILMTTIIIIGSIVLIPLISTPHFDSASDCFSVFHKEDRVRALQVIDKDQIVLAGSRSNGTHGITNDGLLRSFSGSGTLLWERTIGGNESDSLSELLVDHNNNILVKGFTESQDFIPQSRALYPYTGPPITFSQFLSKYSNDGTHLWSYFHRSIGAIAFDSTNNIYFQGGSGDNLSIQDHFFLTKLSSNGTLLWQYNYDGVSTSPMQLLVDQTDHVYLASSFINATTYQADIQVYKIAPNGTLLWYNTYGGTKSDSIQGLFVDSHQQLLLTGETQSSDFFELNESVRAYSGSSDVFLMGLDSNGSKIWGTYFGGALKESIYSVELDVEGKIIVFGSTTSTDLPLLHSFDSTPNGHVDTFLASFHSNGSLGFTTYLGTSDNDFFIGNLGGYYPPLLATDGSITIPSMVDPDRLPQDFPLTISSEDLPPIDGPSFAEFEAILAYRFLSDGTLDTIQFLGSQLTDQDLDFALDSQNRLLMLRETQFQYRPSEQFSYPSTDYDGALSQWTASLNRIWTTYLGQDRETVTRCI